MQTSTSPLTRVYRLHRQYTSTPDSPISTNTPQEAEEATEAHSEVGDLATGVAWEEPSPGETTGTVLRLHVDAVAHGPTEQERNARPQAKSATTVGNSDISQKYADITQTIKIMKRLQSNTLKQKNSLQTTSKVSTPPPTISPMSKRKPPSNASRLQPESTIFKVKTQNILDPCG